MKQPALALALAVSAHAAGAVGPCNLPAPTMIYTDALDGGRFSCAPAPYGPGTFAASTYVTNGTTFLGAVAYWHCSDAWGVWHPQFAAVTAEQLTPTFMASLVGDLASAIAAPDPVAALQAAAASHVNMRMDDPKLAAVWCPVWPAMFASIPKPTPSPSGSLAPPRPFLIDDKSLAWSIRASDGFVVYNGVATNGHATQLLWKGGALYAKSPNGGYWWKWLGNNTWAKLTTAQP